MNWDWYLAQLINRSIDIIPWFLAGLAELEELRRVLGEISERLDVRELRLSPGTTGVPPTGAVRAALAADRRAGNDTASLNPSIC